MNLSLGTHWDVCWVVADVVSQVEDGASGAVVLIRDQDALVVHALKEMGGARL